MCTLCLEKEQPFKVFESMCSGKYKDQRGSDNRRVETVA
jgi:hypothetical protein